MKSVMEALRSGARRSLPGRSRLALGVSLVAAGLFLAVGLCARAAAPDGQDAKLKTRVNPKDGAEMVLIPAGEFQMGDADQQDNPKHNVKLSAYWIYKNDVTVAQFRKFCEAAGRPMPTTPQWGWNDDDPIVNVSWDDAEAYAKWAGGDLPTEAQWEKAARGTDGRQYPWGNDFDPAKAWFNQQRTTAVGKLAVSPYGCADMAGNVLQWCKDRYDANFWTTKDAKKTDPVNETSGLMHVLRGGSWLSDDGKLLRCSARAYTNLPARWYVLNGFRCAFKPGKE